MSEGLARIVAEEHNILDDPVTSPPSSFPAQIHRLETLNITAEANIIRARTALQEYVRTIKQMREDMERKEVNMLKRAIILRRSRYCQVNIDIRLTKGNFRSELTFQKVKKGLSDNIAEEHERTSDEDDIVHEDDVFMWSNDSFKFEKICVNSSYFVML